MTDIIKKLVKLHGCMIGTQTSDYSPERQLEDLIESLKNEQSLPLDNVIDQRELLIAYEQNMWEGDELFTRKIAEKQVAEFLSNL